MKVTCSGFRPVNAENAREAAEVFALRQARKVYGKSATVRTLRLDSWSQDNTFHEWEAFIGRRTGIHETSGHNWRFTTYNV